VRCASAGAERREGGLCADPAYVVLPQAKKKKPQRNSATRKIELLLAMASWGDEMRTYKKSKLNVPWKPEQQKKVVQITRYEKSREERMYDPVANQFRDKGMEGQYKKEEKAMVGHSIQEAKDNQLNYSQTFNVVNHKPNLKAKKMARKQDEDAKRRVPATRAAYDIISNKNYSKHRPVPHALKAGIEQLANLEGNIGHAKIPTSQQHDFNLISNKYIKDHEKKEYLDRQGSQQLAADKFWRTHNFDPVGGTFYDDGKEAEYQRALKVSENEQGMVQAAKIPRAMKYSEGVMYNVVSNEVKDKTKMAQVADVGSRATNSKKGHHFERDIKQRAYAAETQHASRSQQRRNNQSMDGALHRGYDPINNKSTGFGRTPQNKAFAPKPSARQSAYERLW
jgi:hypothetical protein